MNPNSPIDRSRLSGNRTSVGQRLLSSWFRMPALWSLIFLCTVTALVLVVRAANTENHHIEPSETASLLADATGRVGNEVMITVLVNAVSGTVLDATGNPITGGRTIKLIQNGNLHGTTATSDTVTGIYTFTGLTLVSGDKIAVYISGAPEKGATITLSGAADITNLDIRQNVLIVRTDSGVAITNANLKEAEGGSPDPDLTAVRSLDESNVLTLPAGFTLEIASGSTYAPGADINIGGNWLNNGIFDPDTSTVTFNGNSNQTITGSSSTTFNALTISNTGASPDNVVSLDGSAGAFNTVASQLTITSGVFDQGTDLASSSLIVSGTARCVEVRPGATWRNRGRGDETLSCDVFNEGTIEFNAAGKPCGDNDEIEIRSSLPGTQRTWEGPGVFSMIDVDVRDQRVPGGSILPLQILVNSGTNSLNNTGWNFNITCAGPYTWIGGTGQRWADDVNWSPLRPDAGNASTTDELIFDGNVTPAAVVEDVQNQTNRAIRLQNSVLVTLKANVGGATLTLNGDTGTDLDVPAGTLLTFAGSRPLTIELTAAGHECGVAGRIIMQDEAHRLIGANAGEITMTGADAFTTTTGFNGHPFGQGTNGSVVFQSGSKGTFNAGLDPFGGIGNSVVTFESGSTAHFRAATAFFGDTGSTYGNLILDGTQSYTFAGSTQTTILNNLQIEPGSTFLLSNSPGADLNLYGNLVDKTVVDGFSANSRVVKFLGATQTVFKAGSILTLADVLINQSPGGKVQLLSPTDITGQLNLSTASALLELNGQVLELVGTVTGPGNLKGDPNAILAVTGAGALGTVNFVSGGRTLSGLLLNREVNGSMTLGTDLALTGTLRLDNGILNTGANTLSLGPISSVLRTNGYVIGNLQKSFGATGNLGSFTFPLGTDNAYSPLDANVMANTDGTLTVKAVQGQQPNIPGANALQRYWTLSGSGITADLTFHYRGGAPSAGDVVGSEANYKIFKHDGSFTQFTADATGSNSATDHFATLNNVSSFSDWTLAEPFVVPSLSINPTATLAEADSGQQNMTFTVTLTPAHSQTVTVNYATADGSMNPALGGGCGGMTDYVTTTGTLTFDPTVTVQTIDVPICGDNRDEPDETLTVTLDTPTNATISQAIGTGTITDNDPMPVITINDDGVATPYPSNITVSGLTQNIASLTLTLTGLSHTFPGDVDMLLVAPNGATYVFWSDISNFPVNADFTLDDNATNPLPESGPFTGGTFRPANYSPSDTFPGPAPLPFPPYNQAAPTGAATFTSVFGGLTPAQANGTWSLYIVDDTAGDFGQITGGWSLNITEVSAPCDPAPVVSNTGDNGGVNPAPGAGTGTLRQALVDVCAGGTITFDTAGVFSTPQTITLASQLAVGVGVTIDGPDPATQHVTIAGGGASRLFRIQSGTTVTIRELTLTGGSATGDFGGAIYNDHATLTLIGVTVSNNTADFGGGIYNNGSSGGSATLTIVNSTISGNTTHLGDGGGINNFGPGGNATLNLTNSTLSGNNARANGGGLISNGPSGATPVTITNCTITNNRADNQNDGEFQGGGLAVLGVGPLILRNSIVDLNFRGASPSTTADDISAALVPPSLSTHNLVGNCFNPCFLTDGVNNNELNVSAASLNIGPLAANGTINQTHALLPGSIAIEAGNNAYVVAPPFVNESPITDERGTGFPRITDSADANTTQTVDIGAFELHPTIENIADKTTAEDTPFNFNFNIGDDSAPGVITSVTAISSNPALLTNANLIVTGSDGTRNLAITSAADANSPADGTATITVTVTASNGQTAVDTFVLTVTEVNDNPDAVNDPLTAVDEDSGLRVIPFGDLTGNDTKGPANENGQILTVTNVSNSMGGTVQINGLNVEFTPNPNFSGTASFDYTILDNGTTNGSLDEKTDTATASFTINSINDPPSFTIAGDPAAVNEDAGGQTVNSFATIISSGSGESQTLTFNITPNGTTGNLSFLSGPAIDSTTGNLTYTTNTDTNGTATFSVTLSDNGSNVPPNSNISGTQSFTISVNAVDDAPTFTLAAGPTVAEDAGAQSVPSFASNFQPGPVTATDEGTQTLVGYTVTQTGGPLTFSTPPAIDTNGTLTYTATGDTSGSATFDVVATDSGSGVAPNVNQSAAQSFTITVNAANDGPVNTVPGPQATSINTPLVFSSANANQVLVADLDAGTNAIQVALNATNGTLTLSGTSGLSFSFSDSNGTGTGDGTDDGTMTFRGSLTDVNAALNGGSFNPTPGFSGDVTIQIISNDLGFTGGGDVLTDTDSISGTVAPTVSVQDAQAAEPVSGITDILFTVTLNAPAPAGGASVQYATADQAPAPDHAVGGATCGSPGVDYEATNGTVNFAAGEQVKTINVPICSDAVTEPDETFKVLLSGESGATLIDGDATGTIKSANTAGAVLISELRTSGPGGAGDDFVELYNNSDSPLTVAASDASAGYGLYKMGADCNATPVLIGVIPNGTVIPARGHYLFVGSAYSLTNYGGTGAAAGNLTMSADIENDGNVGLFSTSNVGGISSVNRLDAVGFGVNVGGACNLLREGSTLGATAGSTTEHSFFRKLCEPGVSCTGTPKDTNDNQADFMFADTQGSIISGIPQKLGAPGPENISSPIKRDPQVLGVFLDSTKPSSAVPNRSRDFTSDAPNNSTFGTMTIRRRIVNNTGAPVTRLRFRIIDMTTFPSAPGTADLRARTGVNESVGPVNDAATCTASGAGSPPCTVNVQATTLEAPPAQPNGGGMNSSMSSGTITLGSPLANGASINVSFLLGIQQTGTFRFFIIIEALP